MTWNDITVREWQQYIKLANDLKEPSLVQQIEFNEKIVALFFDLPLSYVENLNDQDFKDRLKELDFLSEPIKEIKPKKRIKVNGNYYRIKYDVRKHNQRKQIAMFSSAGDVISVKSFAAKFEDNIGKIMATMVVPQRKILGFYFDKKVKPEDHSRISEEILDAKFIDIYSTCIFFCRLLEKLIQTTLHYLIERKELTMETKKKLTHLLNTMDGFTQLNKSQHTTE